MRNMLFYMVFIALSFFYPFSLLVLCLDGSGTGALMREFTQLKLR